jgi:hypothetical protein
LTPGILLGSSHFEQEILEATNSLLKSDMHQIVEAVLSREAAFLTRQGASQRDIIRDLSQLYLTMCGSKLFKTGSEPDGSTYLEPLTPQGVTDSTYMHPELATVPKGMGVDEYAKAVWIPSGEAILRAAESVK